MTTNSLPAEFADLSPWVTDWALASEEARYRKLEASTIVELRAFYDGLFPRLDAVIRYLDRFTVDTLPADARVLFDLAMTFMETAHPIDLHWDTTEIDDKFPSDRFEFLGPSAA